MVWLSPASVARGVGDPSTDGLDDVAFVAIGQGRLVTATTSGGEWSLAVT
jgi:hypothetical protein